MLTKQNGEEKQQHGRRTRVGEKKIDFYTSVINKSLSQGLGK